MKELKLKSLHLQKENSQFGLVVLYQLHLQPFNNHGLLKKNIKKLDLLLYTENAFDNYFNFILILLTMPKIKYENSKMTDILNFKNQKQKAKYKSKFDINSEDTKDSNTLKNTTRWSKQEIRDFFDCIKYFGIDFQIMQAAFPHKNYKQITNKFHKVKRSNLEKLIYYQRLNETQSFDKEKAADFMQKLLKRI